MCIPRVFVLCVTSVSLGTGGIKPCVSSFVGDQFVKGQEAMLGVVFAMFYFCINAGSLASTIITPLLREYTTVRTVSGVGCWLSHRSMEHFGRGSLRCLLLVVIGVQYYIAFGVPAALLTLATLVFWAGLPTYRIVRLRLPSTRRGHAAIQTSHLFGIPQVPPGANMTNILFGALAVRTSLPSFVFRVEVRMWNFCRPGSGASSGRADPRRGSGSTPRTSMIARPSATSRRPSASTECLCTDRAPPTQFPHTLISPILCVCVCVFARLSVHSSPLPVFWSLFDQHASRWVFQVRLPRLLRHPPKKTLNLAVRALCFHSGGPHGPRNLRTHHPARPSPHPQPPDHARTPHTHTHTSHARTHAHGIV